VTLGLFGEQLDADEALSDARGVGYEYAQDTRAVQLRNFSHQIQKQRQTANKS
jgi:hypothetical protein